MPDRESADVAQEMLRVQGEYLGDHYRALQERLAGRLSAAALRGEQIAAAEQNRQANAALLNGFLDMLPRAEHAKFAVRTEDGAGIEASDEYYAIMTASNVLWMITDYKKGHLLRKVQPYYIVGERLGQPLKGVRRTTELLLMEAERDDSRPREVRAVRVLADEYTGVRQTADDQLRQNGYSQATRNRIVDPNTLRYRVTYQTEGSFAFEPQESLGVFTRARDYEAASREGLHAQDLGERSLNDETLRDYAVMDRVGAMAEAFRVGVTHPDQMSRLLQEWGSGRATPTDLEIGPR